MKKINQAAKIFIIFILLSTSGCGIPEAIVRGVDLGVKQGLENATYNLNRSNSQYVGYQEPYARYSNSQPTNQYQPPVNYQAGQNNPTVVTNTPDKATKKETKLTAEQQRRLDRIAERSVRLMEMQIRSNTVDDILRSSNLK